MKHVNVKDVPAETVEEGAVGVKIRWVIDENDGAERFVMRHFELAPGGFSPRHDHEWEHEVFIVKGTGIVTGKDGDEAFRPGDVIFLPGGEQHQLRNTGSEPVEFICLIPARDKK